MTLSVIIVSYNVKYFLEQCLCSVQRAVDNNVEVLVVDNNSTDGTVEYCQHRFPFAQFISNKENTGFARANNQALAKAKGKYVLFLNPDTIIPEDLFIHCVAFMDAHADAGALGVRMIDGSGAFLKESKRGFPSPWAAFCKMSGLTALFPRSATFARYYMGHLSEKEIQVVDALAGACMLVRKDVLDKTGGFDEQFFMYAEDIDLSYRVQQMGYKNYYFPTCTIIHFKGESTNKDSRYIKLFYKAMIQFVRKHFRGRASGLYIMMLETAIQLGAMLANIFRNPGKEIRSSGMSGKVLLAGEVCVTENFAGKIANEQSSVLIAKADMHLLKSVIQQVKANHVIFCESEKLRFKEIILLMDDIRSKSFLYIFALGSKSIVGSSSSFRQGEIFELK